MQGGEVDRGPRALGMRPFAGVRFTGDGAEVLSRTMDPPDSWAQARRGDGRHVLDLLAPTFAGARADDLVWDRWARAGLVRRDRPSVYVYRRSTPEGATRGLVGAIDLSGEQSAPLLPHEDVHASLVRAQHRVTHATRAQVDPVVALAAHPTGAGGSPLARLLDELTAGTPRWRADAAGVAHELWVHDGPEAAAAVHDVEVGPVVVADGHHRRRAWARDDMGTPPWGLVWLVDADVEPLRLEAVHRVCPGLDLTTGGSSPLVEVRPVTDEAAARAVLQQDGPGCVVRQGGRWWAVRPAPGAPAPSCTLPEHAICWLHQVWLPAWGIDEDAVEHVHGFEAAVRRSDETGDAAVLLPAPRLAAVLAAAEHGTPMPAKATSFVPKPRMGLVMRHWDRPGDDVTVPRERPADTG